jgi:protein-disulfide isomerase
MIGLVIAILGIVVSLYSINHHLEVHANGHTDAACNINATFSCDEVALSKYSEVAGIPLGVFGLGYFAAMALLLGVGLSGHKSADEHLHGYDLLVGIGVLTSLILGGISLGVLGHVCLSCVAIYTLTLLQLIVLAVGRKELIPDGFTLKSATNGAMSAAIAVAVVIAGFNFLKPTRSASSDTPQATNASEPQLLPKAEDIPLTKSAYAGLGEDYRKGGDNAAVVVQEFADFQCPACRAMGGTLETIHKEFGDKVLVVFRNYPLDHSCNPAVGKMHEFSCKAAVMARCAGQYGKFWQYHDLAYGHQAEINDAHLKDWAKEIGLTPDQIESCWNSSDLMAKVKDDIAIGTKLSIDSTPSVYINGHKVVGRRGLDDLRADINDQMK